MSVERGVDAERHADDEGEETGDQGQFQRCGKARQDQFHDRLLEPVGNAELPLRRVADEAEELHEDRVVQPQPLAHDLLVLDPRLDPHHAGDGIADEAEHGKGDQRHDEHDEHRLREAADDEGQHWLSSGFTKGG
jgi:hypothetical protein